jgi:imidazolonepropionase-like amidohydrolase
MPLPFRWSAVRAFGCAVGLLAGASALARSQDLPRLNDTLPAAVSVIRAGRFVDVDRGTVARDQLIIIRGERVERTEPAAGATLPPGARVIDLSAYTVAPGLIDCHTHLVGDAESADVLEPLERSEAQDALTGVRNARATLLAGFTTVRDVGTYRAFVDVALRNAIRDGTVPGPRMAVVGAYITVAKGGGEVTGMANDIVLPAAFRVGVVSTPDEVRERVRILLNGGADLIKIIATGAVLTEGSQPGVTEMSEAMMRAAVEEAGKYGAFVAAHAHGADGIKAAVRAGVRSIEHGSLMDDEAIRLMHEHGTYLVADIYNGDWIEEQGKREGWPAEIMHKNEETTEAQREGFRKAVRVGVKIAFGTDAGVYPHGLNARQLPYMVRYGMTPMAALQSATIVAAQLIGWQDRVGSIAPGKYADLVAVPGDAMADLSSFEHVAFVMKGGVIVKAPTTLQ